MERILAGGLHILTTGAGVYGAMAVRRGKPWSGLVIALTGVLYHAANNAGKVLQDDYGWTIPLVNFAIYAWAFIIYFGVALAIAGQFNVGATYRSN